MIWSWLFPISKRQFQKFFEQTNTDPQKFLKWFYDTLTKVRKDLDADTHWAFLHLWHPCIFYPYYGYKIFPKRVKDQVVIHGDKSYLDTRWWLPMDPDALWELCVKKPKLEEKLFHGFCQMFRQELQEISEDYIGQLEALRNN